MPRPEKVYGVFLKATRVGTLFARDNVTRFVFADEYVEDPDREILGLRFEEQRGATLRANVRLPPWFSNLLPEGRFREWIAQARGVSEHREMDLLAHVGHDLPGAVSVFEDAGDSRESSTLASACEVVSAAPRPSEKIWRFSLPVSRSSSRCSKQGIDSSLRALAREATGSSNCPTGSIVLSRSTNSRS